MANEVSVEITLEEKAALKALASLTKKVSEFGDDAEKSVKKADSAMSTFKGTLGAIATAGAVKQIASSLFSLGVESVEAAANVEKLKTQFETLTGSQEKSNALFEQLKEFSATTPFQLNNIAEASAQLLSFGFAAESVRGRIEKIGEVAAGSNSDLKEVALIYGQVAAAGKLTGERLLQLQERAIPIGSALANTLGVAESKVKDLVSSGVVGFDEFERAFNSLSEEGGLFTGSLDKQSQTLNGAISTLKDNIELLKVELGEAFAPAILSGVKSLTEFIKGLNDTEADTKFTKEGISGLRKELEILQNRANTIAENPLNLPAFLLGDLNETNQKIELYKAKIAEVLKNEKDLVTFRQGSTDAMAQAQEALFGRSEFVTQDPATDPRVQNEVQVNAKILEERAKYQAQVELLKAEQKIKEQEQYLANQELQVQQREQAIMALAEYQNNKVQIELDSELNKNKTIEDTRARQLANEAAQMKASIAMQQNNARAEAAINDARVKNRQMMVAGFGQAIAQAVALTKKGTAEYKALATANAIMNTYSAASRALATFPPPASYAAAAVTIATGLKQVSQIQSQSFATGGVVGGFSGASMGADNTKANVRTGEMILNADQQRQLFDIANRGASQQNNSQVIEVTSIVQIDEREVARAVRNQRLEGFQI